MIIIKTAVEIFWEAVVTLTDGFDTEETETLKELIEKVEGVIDITDLKGRAHGNMSFIDVTVTVNPYLNVIESHKISDQIETTVQHFNPYCIVLVHIEPHFIPPTADSPNKNAKWDKPTSHFYFTALLPGPAYVPSLVLYNG